MDLLQDISNQVAQQQQQLQQPVLKTFERRRRVGITLAEPASPAPDAATPGSSATPSTSSDTLSPLQSSSASDAVASAAEALNKRGRRSSVLHGAALPGHKLFSSHLHTSRSLLLAKMSKARRKAYLEYTQQMAEYFAEVDQFELVVQSPTAATDKTPRSRLAQGATAGSLPLSYAGKEKLQRHSKAAATALSFQSDTPAVAAVAAGLQAATPASAAPSHYSSPTEGPQEPDHLLLASPCSPTPTAAAESSLTCTVHSAATTLQAPEPAAVAHAAAAVTGSAPEATQALVSSLGLQSDMCMEAASVAASSRAASSRAVSSLVAETPLQQQQQQPGMLHSRASTGGPEGVQSWFSLGSSGSARFSLAASTPAAQDLTNAWASASAATVDNTAAAAQADVVADADAVGVGGWSDLSAMTLAGREPFLQQQDPGTQPTSTAAHQEGALSAAVAPGSAGGHVGDVNSSSSGIREVSLAATTPAGSQQADMQQLMVGMQELWLAEAPTDAVAPCRAGATQQQDAVDAPAAAASKKQATQKQKQGRKGQQQGKQAPAEAAKHGHEEELQEHQQQQQQLADQHYQKWMQQKAEAAAAAELQALELEATAAADLTPLQQMLKACGQGVSEQHIPSMVDFLTDVVDLRDVVKIGEGTYGEAFKSGQVVLKFVPMEGSNLINGWPQKGAGDLLGEAVIALALTDLGHEVDESGSPHASYTQAFVQTHRVGVCQGPYPAAFVKAWKAWDKRHKSENDAIGGLPDEQLYAVFAMANCGRDLESYHLQGYEQVRSLMLQTALALAVAEEALAFEHRDLHWGNIMLSPPQDTHITARLNGCNIRVRAEGARVRLIDFTASRLQTPGGDVVFCDLEGEDGLFDGPKGKPQFETYRRMRKHTNKDWTGSYPGTNVLWLLYLTELLLSSEKPIPGATAAQKRNLREFKKRLAGYSNCSDVIWDALFEGLWAAV